MRAATILLESPTEHYRRKSVRRKRMKQGVHEVCTDSDRSSYVKCIMDVSCLRRGVPETTLS